MIKTALATAGIVALLSAPAHAAQGSSGPFTGHVRQNQVRTHRFDNNPLGLACPQVMTSYTVSLAYTPTTDALTLSVGSLSTTGSNGTASLTVEGSYCTQFDIKVAGTSVDTVAHYTVTVSRGGATTVELI
ncbi:MAG TPA: hypothetical protein VNQ77_12375 [Frankiaceae bacterium]|nr:hypothetical protein [Frankiaceae bacterium]